MQDAELKSLAAERDSLRNAAGEMKSLQAQTQALAERANAWRIELDPAAGAVNYPSFTLRLSGLKIGGARGFQQPILVVSIVDEEGVVLSRQGHSKPCAECDDQGIAFKNVVTIGKPAQLPAKGVYLFFEFKHYKAASNKYSVKCFGWIDLVSAVNGGNKPLTVQMNAKPTDFLRKIVKKFNASLSLNLE